MSNASNSWTPHHGTEVAALPAGRWWKAVRVPAHIGERALALLGEDSGAVIQDWRSMYWLVPAGAGPCPELRAVAVLPASDAERVYVGVPPVHWTEGPGLRWRVPAGRELTDTDTLFLALRIATSTAPDTTSAPEAVR
ncbi:hypothetical protein [Streptomyces sp. NPDC018031]|uniref:hypothetical protein n=1 Tax=Streptomyces sp. NPDC018031 TaxID=3365033 RepID=UPI003789FEAB